MSEKKVESVEFKEHFAEERRYYMGKLKPTDTIPGSNVTIEAARKAYREEVAKQDKHFADRRNRYVEQFNKENEPAIMRTSVTHGVVADVKMQPRQILDTNINAENETGRTEAGVNSLIPEKEILEGMDKEQLLAVAEENNLPAFKGNASKDSIIKALLVRREHE